MAFDKVIDSAELDGAITATANAIREKAESAEKIEWNRKTGFAEAVRAITVDPTKVTILREQTFAGFVVDPTFGAYSPGYVMPALFQLENGKTYYVNWDGIEYECVAYSYSYGDSTIVAIGNGGSLGLPSNNEPFLISYNATYDNSQLFSTEAKDSHTVGIWQKAAGGSSDDVRYVTFMSEDGTAELGKKAVATGDDCADPIARGVFSTPTKESTAQYNYTFYGWATTPNGAADSNWNKAVTEDRTVYANFASVVRYYTITYYDSDGTTVLKTESLAYGSIPSYTPTKNGYTFKGWTTEIVEVTGDASYIATWAAQEKLEDYTWAQLNAMSIAELKAKFKIGDCKDKYALVGFEQDTTSSGEKVKMTFISGNLVKSMELNTYSDTYTDMAHYTNIRDNPSTYIPDYSAEIASVAKSVKKKYLSSRTNGSIVEVSQKFWVPSASEFGYIPDGTTVLDEGNAYSAFNKVSFGSNISATYTTTLYSNFALGKRALRTRNPAGCLYLNSGKATQLNGNASNIDRASSVYFTVGFCI